MSSGRVVSDSWACGAGVRGKLGVLLLLGNVLLPGVEKKDEKAIASI